MEELDEETMKLLLEYSRIIEELYKKGVTNSSNIVGGFGEYWACKHFNLTPAEKQNNKGYDAIDSEGKTYQIRARKTFKRKPKNFSGKLIANYLIYIEFNENWEPVILLKIPNADVKTNVCGRIVISKELKKKFNVM